VTQSVGWREIRAGWRWLRHPSTASILRSAGSSARQGSIGCGRWLKLVSGGVMLGLGAGPIGRAAWLVTTLAR
jgi:hypothetical protein